MQRKAVVQCVHFLLVARASSGVSRLRGPAVWELAEWARARGASGGGRGERGQKK